MIPKPQDPVVSPDPRRRLAFVPADGDHVRQQSHLARELDGRGDLGLVTAAGAVRGES